MKELFASIPGLDGAKDTAGRGVLDIALPEVKMAVMEVLCVAVSQSNLARN